MLRRSTNSLQLFAVSTWMAMLKSTSKSSKSVVKVDSILLQNATRVQPMSEALLDQNLERPLLVVLLTNAAKILGTHVTKVPSKLP